MHPTAMHPKHPTPLIVVLLARVQALENEPNPGPAGSPEYKAHHARLRSARLSLARAKGTHTTAQWLALVEETGGHCVRCGREHAVILGEMPCKGYVVPLAAGGSNAIDNIQPLCRSCASAKGGEIDNWLALWRAGEKTP